jgi:cytokinin dehydrogenase
MSDEIIQEKSMNTALDLRQKLSGRVVIEDSDLQGASQDFGRIRSKKPAIVIRPSSTEDVVQSVRFAVERNLALTVRGAAHSQSGQCLSENGLLLDIKSLNRMIEFNPQEETVLVEGGMIWDDLVKALVPRSFVPPVLTNNLNVTVSGTLSVAGLGVASHRYGTQADQCVELEVVTGTGEVVVCSAQQNRELFDAVRAGLGQFGVITQARLRLRKARSHFRTHFLLYDNLAALMEDARLVMQQDRFDFIESWAVPCPQGFRKTEQGRQPFAAWFFPLHLTEEFDASISTDSKDKLSGLSFYRRIHTEEGPLLDFLYRLQDLFALWKRAGYWDACHPWVETVLPWQTAEPFISRVLADFPPHALGGGHILLWPCRGTASKVPFFQTPPTDFVIGFGILPGVPRPFLEEALPRLDLLSDLGQKVGGKRYLSGWINFDLAKWQAHFEEKWAMLVELKSKYDPRGILNPGFIPLSNQE